MSGTARGVHAIASYLHVPDHNQRPPERLAGVTTECVRKRSGNRLQRFVDSARPVGNARRRVRDPRSSRPREAEQRFIDVPDRRVVRAQRRTGGGRCAPPPARRAPRGARRHVPEGRLLAVGPVRVLHGARSTARRWCRCQVGARPRRGQGRSPRSRAVDRAERDALAAAFAATGALQCGFCTPGHPRAGRQGAARQEGQRPRPRDRGPPPRRPPVPVHRLREDPRRGRGARRRASRDPGRPCPAASATSGTRYEGSRAGPRRQGLHRRHPARRDAARRRRTSADHARADVVRIDTTAAEAAARRRAGAHRRRRPRRARASASSTRTGRCSSPRAGARPTSATCSRSSWPRTGRPPGRPPQLVEVDYDVARARSPTRSPRSTTPRTRCGASTATCCRARPTPAATSTPRFAGQRPRRPRGVPDPAHRARLPRARVDRSPSRAPTARLHVYSGGQGVWDDRDQIASVLGIERDQVTVELVSQRRRVRRQGGHAQPGARPRWPPGSLGRPVKCTLTREESLLVHPKRHPIRIEAEAGVRRRRAAHRAAGPHGRRLGPLRSVGHEGARAGGRPRVRARTTCPTIDVEAVAARTNNPVCGAFRGFGANQAQFAMEGAARPAGRAGRHPRLGDPRPQRRSRPARCGARARSWTTAARGAGAASTR